MKKEYVTVYPVFGFLTWLGGCVHVANQPGYGFWDGLIWMFYFGRYVASHWTTL